MALVHARDRDTAAITDTPVNRWPRERWATDAEALLAAYRETRERTLALTAGLSAEDQQVQSMPDASPTKWHLAHTTWFFATFILAPFQRGFEWPDARYKTIFNSYYNAVCDPFLRPRRGLLTRPSLTDVRDWRAAVDADIAALLPTLSDEDRATVAERIVLGINHEQQHQELLVTDALHALSHNPMADSGLNLDWPEADCGVELAWLPQPGGRLRTGYRGDGFHFDNEGPEHESELGAFEMANRPVTQGDWLAFIEDGGYKEPRWWLSDGWAWRCDHDITAPGYWRREDGDWRRYTPAGWQPVAPDAPVTHLSYYEADAYASWAGARLPTEFEWEAFARSLGWRGEPEGPNAIGQCWEWTASAYAPYPGFRASDDALGEYNGKFMVNQLVLRGASPATAPHHSRASYRNFFYPHQRWQFSGLRLAR